MCGHLQGSCVVSQDTAGGLARRWASPGAQRAWKTARPTLNKRHIGHAKGVCLCFRALALVARDKLPIAVKAERGGGEG